MKSMYHYFLIILSMSIFFKCDCGSNKAFKDEPKINTKVEFIYPNIAKENKTTDFPVNGKVVITINKPINYDTAESSVTIVDVKNLSSDTPKMVLDSACLDFKKNDGHTAVFQFDEKLLQDHQYKLIIDGLKDNEGGQVERLECDFKTSNLDTVIYPVPKLYSESKNLIQLKMVDAGTELFDVLINPYTIEEKGFHICKSDDLNIQFTCSVTYNINKNILNVFPDKNFLPQKGADYVLKISKYINKDQPNEKPTLTTLAGVLLGVDSYVSKPLRLADIITASDGREDDRFGDSAVISEDGSTIVVGCSWGNVSANEDQGAVYVYSKYGDIWSETKITASDGDAGDYFGKSIAASYDGNIIVVGANGDDVSGDSGQGAVYVYMRAHGLTGETWSETKITASDGDAGDCFGESVAISEDANTIVVGSHWDDVNGNTDQGTVYVYTRKDDNWSEQKIIASDGDAGDYFGKSVAISNDSNIIVVGSDGDDINGIVNQGSVYVYTRDGNIWNEQKITASDGVTRDYFGQSIAVALTNDGYIIIVGCPSGDSNGNVDRGAVYMYTRIDDIWKEQKIIASDGSDGDYFGESVAISGDGNVLVVGSYHDDFGLSEGQGSAYVFFNQNGNNWSEQKITADDGMMYDYFGRSVAISGDSNIIVIGSDGEGLNGNNDQGSVYIIK